MYISTRWGGSKKGTLPGPIQPDLDSPMASPSSLSSPILRLAFFLIVLGLVRPRNATDAPSNLLFSGETLVPGGRLAQGDHRFVVGDDCNLALDESVWQSGTTGRGSACRLTLEDDGRLVVRSEDGAAVWSSLKGSGTRGEYVAVLDTRGRVTVYGPAVWSAAELSDPRLSHQLGCLKGGKWDNCLVVGDTDLQRSPSLLQRRNRHWHHKLSCLNGGKWDNCIISDASTSGNALFSGQILLDRSSLKSGGRFLRLDHRGNLAVVDDSQRVFWSNNAQSAQGEYVAVPLRDGEVAVYGPAIWSTAAPPADHLELSTSVNRKIGDVKMVTERE